MKKTLLSLSALAVLALSLSGFTRPQDKMIVRVYFTNYHTQMAQIQKMGLDLAGVNIAENHAEFVVTEKEAKTLQSKGFKIYLAKSAEELRAPDSKYFTSEKVEVALQQIEKQYPTLVKMTSIGKSLEGRNIWSVKITKDVNKAQAAKPSIFFNGMHHAREVMSVEVPMDIIQTLTSQYGKNTQITQWVDSNEIYVVPMFNVDGNHIVWTTDNMWRKNAHGGYGVDINRNYPYAWNSCNGSSGSTSAQDYRGPNAGSEPETQVMMNFVKQIRPVFSISYHSYSEIVIYPYGCPREKADDQKLLAQIGKEIGSSIKTDSGNGTYKAGTAYELLYPVDGGDIDWMYHEYKVLPFVVEVNSTGQGFQPSYDKWRQKTVDNNRPGWQVLMKKLQTPAFRDRGISLKSERRI